MNSEIWANLNQTARITDIKCQQLQQTLSQGLIALSQIANEVAKASSSIPAEIKANILKIAIDGANLLGDQLQSNNNKRRAEVKRYINPEFHGICSSQV